MSSQFEQIENLKHLAQVAYDEDRIASVVELSACYLEHFPNDEKTLFNYGDALRIVGQFGKAAVALAKAAELCPLEYTWTVYCRLGMLYNAKGDYSTAARWFTRALESEEAQRQSWLWVLRGVAFASQAMFDEAEECYQKAIAVNSNDDEAYLNLGLVNRAKGNYQKAIDAANTALGICPDYPEAKKLLLSLDGALAAQQLAQQLCTDGKN